MYPQNFKSQFQETLYPTAQAKMIAVARDLGLGGISNQQGTTRTIYDSLPLVGTGAGTLQIFEFFKGCNARNFPLTNLPANKLEVGEIMVIEEMTLSVLTLTATSDVTNVRTMSAAALTGMYRSDLEVDLGNQTVIKPLNMVNLLPAFNNFSENATGEVFKFKTFIVIPPQLEFVVRLKVTSYAAIALNHLSMTLTGAGGIFAPKNNF